jgi:inhibitor of KinA sporulation pathway (predicted exonuclease)
VICDSKHNFVTEFYSTVRPIRRKKLTIRCKRLTNLTQEEIDESLDCELVMKEVVKLLHKYSIQEVFVYGDCDKPALLSDINIHKKRKENYESIQFVADKIVDIQPKITRLLGLIHPVNVEKLSNALGWFPNDNEKYHNALIDARALYQISKAAYTAKVNDIPSFSQLKNEQKRIAMLEKKILERDAFQIPASADEIAFIKTLSDPLRLNYYRTRLKIINAFSKYPNEFVFSVYVGKKRKKKKKYKKRVVIKPKLSISEEYKPSHTYYNEFEKNHFIEFLISNYKTIQEAIKK